MVCRAKMSQLLNQLLYYHFFSFSRSLCNTWIHGYLQLKSLHLLVAVFNQDLLKLILPSTNILIVQAFKKCHCLFYFLIFSLAKQNNTENRKCFFSFLVPMSVKYPILKKKKEEKLKYLTVNITKYQSVLPSSITDTSLKALKQVPYKQNLFYTHRKFSLLHLLPK